MIYRKCDRCDGDVEFDDVQDLESNEPKLVDGLKQGLFCPVPRIVDLCHPCRRLLHDWLHNKKDGKVT